MEQTIRKRSVIGLQRWLSLYRLFVMAGEIDLETAVTQYLARMHL